MNRIWNYIFLLVSCVCGTFTFAIAEQPAASIYTLKPVAELYTSQSCPRCPVGNDNFSEFVISHDVIGLSFSVDYWDYTGWKDTFAHAKFSDRQKELNTYMGRRGPYTPQVVLNGKTHCSAVKPKKMQSRYEGIPPESKTMTVSYDGKTIFADHLPSDTEVYRVKYMPGERFETPKSGKNKHKAMLYHNVVTDIESAGHFGAQGHSTSLEVDCMSRCAFIFQEKNSGNVLGGFFYPAKN